jgi:hypothetical protein
MSAPTMVIETNDKPPARYVLSLGFKRDEAFELCEQLWMIFLERRLQLVEEQRAQVERMRRARVGGSSSLDHVGERVLLRRRRAAPAASAADSDQVAAGGAAARACAARHVSAARRRDECARRMGRPVARQLVRARPADCDQQLSVLPVERDDCGRGGVLHCAAAQRDVDGERVDQSRLCSTMGLRIHTKESLPQLPLGVARAQHQARVGLQADRGQGRVFLHHGRARCGAPVHRAAADARAHLEDGDGRHGCRSVDPVEQARIHPLQ